MTEQKKTFVPISQIEAAYTPLSAISGQACANCRFYQTDPNGFTACVLIANGPETILATGYCNRWEAMPEMPMFEETPLPVIVVGEVEYEGEMDKAISEPGILRKAIDAIVNILKPAKAQTQFKSLGGGYWIAWYSNNLEDREKEIIAAEAHDKFISRVKAGIMPYPELWFWHIPGTAHGKAIWLDRIGHMTVALGRFSETPLGGVMKAHYENNAPMYAMSHGFTADKNNALKNGVWYDINTFEISPLSPDAAANVFTLFSEVKTMASEQALAALKTLLTKGLGEADGDKAYQDILSTTETMNKEAAALGTRYKDFTDPAKAEAPDPAKAIEEVSKSIAPYLLELMQAQADSVKVQTAQAAEIDSLKKAYEGKVSALESTVARLQAELSLTPQRASESKDTQLAKAAAAVALSQREGVYNPFWADLGVPE